MTVEYLEPNIRAQVLTLCQSQDSHFEVEEIKKGAENATFADRFVVVQYFCFARLKWHVIYNIQALQDPPDVVFGPGEDAFQPLVPSEDDLANRRKQQMWSLQQTWDVRQPSGLLQLLLELRQQYQYHHRKLVQRVDDARVRFEIQTMSDVKGLEMYVAGDADKPEEVQFSVPLGDINFEPLGALLSGGALGGPADPSALSQAPIELQVRFVLARGGQKPPPVTLKLMAATAVLDALSLADAKLPGWTETTCLMEYLPVLQTQIQQQVDQAGAAVELRRSFIAFLPLYFGRPLEADTVQCRKATVFITLNGQHLLLHIVLPSQFPKQQPLLTLQSSQHFDANGRPITSRGYDDYPWSPRWDHHEILRRMMIFLQDEAPNFKRQCNELVQRR